MGEDTAVATPSRSPGRRTPEQRGWFVSDGANSASVTTTATVLTAPYLTSVARAAACPGLADASTGRQTLDVPGVLAVPAEQGQGAVRGSLGQL